MHVSSIRISFEPGWRWMASTGHPIRQTGSWHDRHELATRIVAEPQALADQPADAPVRVGARLRALVAPRAALQVQGEQAVRRMAPMDVSASEITAAMTGGVHVTVTDDSGTSHVDKNFSELSGMATKNALADAGTMQEHSQEIMEGKYNESVTAQHATHTVASASPALHATASSVVQHGGATGEELASGQPRHAVKGAPRTPFDKISSLFAAALVKAAKPPRTQSCHRGGGIRSFCSHGSWAR